MKLTVNRIRKIFTYSNMPHKRLLGRLSRRNILPIFCYCNMYHNNHLYYYSGRINPLCYCYIYGLDRYKNNEQCIDQTLSKQFILQMEDFDMEPLFGNTNTNILSQVKSYATKKAMTYLKNEFGVTLKLKFDDKSYIKFLRWLKKYDKNFKSHLDPVTKLGTIKIYRLKDCDFIIKCGYHTYARIYTQTAIKDSLNKVDVFNDVRVDDDIIHMYIFGKECYKVAREIKNISTERKLGCFKISKPKFDKNEDAAPDVYYDELKGRRKDTIFLNDNIKEEIISHIDTFLDNRDIYEKRNLIFKTGILLYGEAGTGKSSLANMIATEYGCDMVLINMSEFAYINTDFLASTLNADDKMYIVVLEDIDCVIGDREDETQDLENKKNVQKLLQFLDSTSSPTNVIFVATTNHIDKLDDAIKRDGRFDVKYEITNFNRSSATKMCKSFGIVDEDAIENILNNMENGTINPAKLQNIILQRIHI